MAIEQDLYYVRIDESGNVWLHKRGTMVHVALFLDKDIAYNVAAMLCAQAALDAQLAPPELNNNSDEAELPF